MWALDCHLTGVRANLQTVGVGVTVALTHWDLCVGGALLPLAISLRL